VPSVICKAGKVVGHIFELGLIKGRAASLKLTVLLGSFIFWGWMQQTTQQKTIWWKWNRKIKGERENRVASWSHQESPVSTAIYALATSPTVSHYSSYLHQQFGLPPA
jgi:hypothetical protein